MKIQLCYFNEVLNIYCYSKFGYSSWKSITEEKLRVLDNTATFRITTYESDGIAFYTFGLLYDNKNRRPNHGGEWSSNGDYFTMIKGIEIVSCGLDQIAAYMTREDALKLIPIATDFDKFGCGVTCEHMDKFKYEAWYDIHGVEIVNRTRPRPTYEDYKEHYNNG